MLARKGPPPCSRNNFCPCGNEHVCFSVTLVRHVTSNVLHTQSTKVPSHDCMNVCSLD